MSKTLNPTFAKLVQILNDGEYHDGTSLGMTLGVSRSAVWKAIKKLQSYQVKLSVIKGKGYALLEPLTLLDVNSIMSQVRHRAIGLYLFESVTSTNTVIKSIQSSDLIKVCLAEQQTQGRGRMGREWFSPFGKNIYFSCSYPFHKDVGELSGLSLVMSLAVIKTLNQQGVRKGLFVKWPNDLLYENKKIAGSLIEIQAETHGMCHAVIGVGINVNLLQDEGCQSISRPWTSISEILKSHIDRNTLCASLMNHLIDYLQRFDQEGFVPFIKEWQQVDCLVGQWITLKHVNETFVGRVRGINSDGHLLLEREDGEIQAFSSGDTSLHLE
jgi:BirA family biotin operon repressor/biotin-[acetyl-CoA-carboxylase] ligase